MYGSLQQSRPHPPRHANLLHMRSSAGVFRFRDLPRELQLLVIEACLPTVNDVSRDWPAPIPALLRTSRQFKIDTETAMRKWSPLHCVPNPSHLHSLPRPGVVRVEDICLSLFHDARIDVLLSSARPWARPYDHRGLVMVWSNLVGFLPLFDSIRSVAVDATPVPGWLRHDKPAWIPRLVAERAVSDRFIYEHVAVVADLIAAITNFYNSVHHPVTIELVGQYGDRSHTFPNYVVQRCRSMNVSVPFTGQILPAIYHDDRTPDVTEVITVRHAIDELYSNTSSTSSDGSRPSPQQLQSQAIAADTARRRLLQGYTYTPASDFFFRNLFLDNQYDTMRLLERLTDYALLDYEEAGDKKQPRYLDVQTSGFARGSFICSLAKDLRLQTSSRGNWQKEEIRLIKRDPQLWQKEEEEEEGATTARRAARDAGGGTLAGSLTNFLVNTAVVVFFALDAAGW